MIRIVCKRCLLASSFPFSIFSNNDQVLVAKERILTSESAKDPSAGWIRVKEMFTKDDFGRLSAELHSVIQIGFISSLVGALYGGFLFSREAYLDFMRNNQATVFESHFEAKKFLQDKVSLGFAKGAFKWGWRLNLFTSMYMLVSTTISAYRGKNGILEHTLGAGAAGAVYKFKMGPRGWIVGGALGCTLGTLAGTMTYSIQQAFGVSMNDVRYYNYRWVEMRSEAFRKGVKPEIEDEETQLLADHYNANKDKIDINIVDGDVENVEENK